MSRRRNVIQSMILSMSMCFIGENSSKRPRRTTLNELPNELFFEIFSYLSLIEIYRCFYRLNSRFDRLIGYSCLRGWTIRTTEENNLFLRDILPFIRPSEIETLTLWHNTSYQQLLNSFSLNLHFVDNLVLKRLKNLSFFDCQRLLKHFKCLKTLSMIDFNTSKIDWLDDHLWKDFIQNNLPNLHYLHVRICIYYPQQLHDDDKENIIYSYTSRFARSACRFYTGSLVKKNPILEISLTIDRVISRL